MGQLENSPENFEPKLLKEILFESVFDLLSIFGINKGVLRTLIDLIKKPAQVIEAYHQNDLTYTRPMAFILIASGVFLFVANYLIKWDVFSSLTIEFFLNYFKFFSQTDNLPPEILNLIDKYVTVGFELFFSKFLVVFFIAHGFFRAAVLTKFKEGVTYGNMLVIMLYRNGGSMFIQAGSLLCLLIPNIFGVISYMLVATAADHYAFRNYINLTFGQGSKRHFQKRQFKLVAIGGILILLGIGLILIGFYLNRK
jgi:hypothetical protein